MKFFFCLFSALTLSVVAGSLVHAPAKKKFFEDRARSEGWTFHFSPPRAPRAMGLRKKPMPRERHVQLRRNAPIPNALDLRRELTPIEDQGECGSCWAFSLTATHRDGHALNGHDPGRLSQQYLVDCAASQSGCNGGYFDAADYLKLGGLGAQGAPSFSAYPYQGMDGKCQGGVSAAAHITGWRMLGAGDSPTVLDIEAYVAEFHKPVSITVAAGTGAWSSYASGIYNACEMGGTDHMINIVGWDNEGYAFQSDGSLPPGRGVWILRNSWGTGWGEQGYMRTRMTDAQGRRCNDVAAEAAYFTFDDDPQPGPTPEPSPLPPPPQQPTANPWLYLVLGIAAAVAVASTVVAIALARLNKTPPMD